MHSIPAAAICIALGTALPASAAAPAPDDLDALSLADQAPAAKADAASPWRVFIEGAAGQGRVRGNPERQDTSRASLDLRLDTKLADGWRAVLSNRLDLTDGGSAPDANTLREAYLSWAPAPDLVLDIGRVNIRHGVAWGYNPTDWFRANALRSVVSPDPAVLRENRLGTFVLQGQKLWGAGSLTAAFSPKLADASTAPNPSTFALGADATNPRSRWLLAGSYKLGDRLNPELLAYGGAGTPTQLGLNVSSLVGDAAVVFAEFSTGRGRTLAAQALALPEAERTQRRGALGLTYTTPFNLNVTVEAEYNSAAPDRAQWQALPGLAPRALLGTAQALQDLPVRRATFVYATWKDAVLRRLDLSAYLRRDGETRSRDQWFEARYRWDRADLSLQWQLFSGAPGSVFGSVPQRRTVELVFRTYL